MVLRGRKLVKYADHEEVLKTGDAYYMARGHTTVTDAGTEWLEFSPRKELSQGVWRAKRVGLLGNLGLLETSFVRQVLG